jgi:integrase
MSEDVAIIEGPPAKVTNLPPSDKDDTDDAREGRVLPKILTYDQIDRFLLAIDNIEDLVACRLMLFGGLRVAEAADVLVKDIHPETLSVFVRQGKGSKDRYAPIDTGTIALSQCYAKSINRSGEEHLFKSTKRTLQRHVELTYGRADIYWGVDKEGNKIIPGCHTLRHTCATWQLDQGIPLPVVQGNLGHEDIETTQIYLHLNIRQRARTYRDCTRFGT